MSESAESIQSERKKVILSGIQPSGNLTLGVMSGALRNWVKLQEEYDAFFCVVDLHAITVRQVPAELRKRTLDALAMFIAAGVNPEKSTMFVQSHVHQHAELAWILNTFTQYGEASRMTQFKDKSEQHSDNINVGLFTYPVLMAADILLYQADVVPVGEDQKQHLELSRDIANRFNNAYSPTFTIPDPYIPESGGKIMSLQEPTKKMSKSDANQNATIYLNDSNDVIRNKIKRAVTDSGTDITYSSERPGISNLMEIYHVATGKSIEEVSREFANSTYSIFKEAVAEALVAYIEPVRTRFESVRADTTLLNTIATQGAEKAQFVARKTLRKVYKKIGFWQPE